MRYRRMKKASEVDAFVMDPEGPAAPDSFNAIETRSQTRYGSFVCFGPMKKAPLVDAFVDGPRGTCGPRLFQCHWDALPTALWALILFLQPVYAPNPPLGGNVRYGPLFIFLSPLALPIPHEGAMCAMGPSFFVPRALQEPDGGALSGPGGICGPRLFQCH